MLRMILILVGAILAQSYDQSLGDCKAVAAKFLNTCAHGNYDTPATSMDTMASETYRCENKRKCIPGGVKDGSSCSWERKLCVTCRINNGITKIRVQTNNLPNHCIQSVSAKAQNFDYEVTFNPKEVYGSWEKNIKTQNQLNNAVCPIVKRYDAAQLGIEEFGADESVNAMGIAINGVAFQFANQIKEDPVYPITVLNEQPLDLCLGHNQQDSDSGMYHYHDVSPCLNPNFLDGKTMSDCSSNPECKDTAAWALSGFSSMKTRSVIGIAKDGHVLNGPYDDTGKTWQTKDVDACNGAWSSDQGDYFYVATQWHPYLVGCLGPANFPQSATPGLYAQCSLNGMDQYLDADGTPVSPAERQLNPSSPPHGAAAPDSALRSTQMGWVVTLVAVVVALGAFVIM